MPLLRVQKPSGAREHLEASVKPEVRVTVFERKIARACNGCHWHETAAKMQLICASDTKVCGSSPRFCLSRFWGFFVVP